MNNKIPTLYFCFFLVSIILLLVAEVKASQEHLNVVRLDAESSLVRNLRGGQTHINQIDLTQGQFIHIIVEQKGIDVILTLIGPDDQIVSEMDSPNETLGNEAISWIANDFGTYQLKVSSLSEDAVVGQYEVQIEELRKTIPKDKIRLSAEKLFSKAGQFYAQHTEEFLINAIEKYEKALPLWRDLEDSYMEALTIYTIAAIYFDLGYLEQAIKYYSKSLPLVRKINFRIGEAVILSNLGSIFVGLGEKQKALECLKMSLNLCQTVGDSVKEDFIFYNILKLYNNLGMKQEPSEWAEILYDNASKLYQGGKLDSALSEWNKAASLYRIVNAELMQSLTLNYIGEVYRIKGQHATAIMHYLQALSINKKIEEKNGQSINIKKGKIIIYNNLGLVYNSAMKYDEALKNFQYALNIAEDINDIQIKGLIIGNIIGNIGEVYIRRGEYQKALEQHQMALEQHQEALALEQHQEAMEQHQIGIGKAYNNIGSIYHYLGQYNKALEYFQDALNAWKDQDNTDQKISTLNNIGAAYRVLAQYKISLEYYQKALEIAKTEKKLAKEGIVLDNIGQVFMAIGQYQKALENSKKARKIKHKTGNLVGEAITLINIGNVYNLLDQYRKSLDFYMKALDILKGDTDKSDKFVLGLVLDRIGVAYDNLKEYLESLKFYQKALAIRRDIGDRTGEGITLNNIGLINYKIGKPYDAIKKYLASLEILRDVEDNRNEEKTLSNIGYLFESDGDLHEALQFYKQSIKINENIRTLSILEEFKTSIAEQAVDAYQKAILLYIRLDNHSEAFNLSERARARTFLDQLGNYRLNIRKDASKNLIKQEQDLRSDLNALNHSLRNEKAKPHLQYDSNLIQNLTAQINDKQKQYAELLTKLKVENKEYNSLISVNPLTLKQIQNLLDENTTLLSYFFTSDKTLAFIVKKDSFQIIELKVPIFSVQNVFQNDLSNLILSENMREVFENNGITFSQEIYIEVKKQDREWTITDKNNNTQYFIKKQKNKLNCYRYLLQEDVHAAIENFRSFDDRFGNVSDPNLLQLNNWLIEPLESKLNTDFLGIIPHGILHYLPFAALTDGKRYLCDDYAIFNLPSASILQFLPNKRKGYNGKMLAIANSQVDGYPFLEFADEEVIEIAQLFNEKPLIGKDATESFFTKQSENFNLIHISSHGELNSKNPLFSNIILKPNNGSDGLLEVHEVYELDLKQAFLVTLSACQTNLGAQSLGDDVIGLNRAFIYAGTPTLIASLWKVNDGSTKELMKSFYTNLQQGMGKADALREAQKNIRTEYPHPYYWAPFVLTGDPGWIDSHIEY